MKDLSLTSLRRDEIPKVTNLRLTDTVNAAKPLLDSVGIPWQIVIDHQVRALQVDALARRIGSDEHPHLGILAKRLLSGTPRIPVHAAFDGQNDTLVTEQRRDLLRKILQGVFMLGEDDELLALAIWTEHARIVLKQ